MPDDTQVVAKIDAGKRFKKTIEFDGMQFTPHRLSIGEKIKVGVLVAQRTNEVKVDKYTDQIAYIAAWLDIALDPADNPDWKGAESIYDEDYLVRLYNACWEAVEKPFFRPQDKGTSETTTA